MTEPIFRTCPGCKIQLPITESPIVGSNFERYGVASPECLMLFQEVLAHEYTYGFIGDKAYAVHAYAVQHPPHEEYQQALGIAERFRAASRQSVVIHLLALYLLLEKKAASSLIDRILTSGERLEDIALHYPEDLGVIKVSDVINATNADEHQTMMHQWARAAWDAWSHEHARIKKIYESAQATFQFTNKPK